MNDRSKNQTPQDKASAKESMEDTQWIEDSLQSHLDARADNLDYTVTSKLSAARHRALSLDATGESTKNSPTVWFNWVNAAGGTAVLALAIVFGMRVYSPIKPQTEDPIGLISQQVLMEDLNMLSSSDDIEFYQAVEFLEWMETNSG